MCKISISETPLQMNNQIKVRDEQWRKKLKSNYSIRDVSFDNLHRVVSSDYRTYSAGEFTDGYAKNDNWVSQDLLILDIDDGLALTDALEVFADYKAMLHTSTSHQKEKGGIKCDRYRVIIPLLNTTSCTVQEYTDTMKMLAKSTFSFIDHKCVDPARIYFGFADCEIFYTEGQKLFDFSHHLGVMKKIKEIGLELKAPPPMTVKQYSGDSDVIGAFNTEHTISEILSRNSYKEIDGRWLSPRSSTGVAGVILSQGDDGKEWAYNHHSSDDWENCDAYGIYCAVEFNGDSKEAFKSLLTPNQHKKENK